MKKALCFILALMMVTSMILVSCGKENQTTTQGGGNAVLPTTEEDKSGVYDAEIKKLNREFTFIVRNMSNNKHLDTHEIYAEAITGDKINDAVFSRNSKLELDYGVTVKEVRDDAPHTNFREALIAGEYIGDFLFTGIVSMKTLGAANLLVDYNTLSNFDSGKVWWNQQAQKALTVNGKCFYLTGDAATLDDRATWIMLFNKDIVQNAGLESPYSLVEAGTWTIDKMYEYMQQTSVDGNGDGVYKYNTVGEIVGYCGEKFNNWAHVAAGKITISNMAEDGTITIPEQPKQELLDAWSKLRNVLTSPMRYMSGGSTAFKKNLVTFSGLNAAVVLLWAEAEVNFGVLPFPKVWAEQDGYYTAPSQSQFGVFSIPNTVAADKKNDWAANGFTTAAEQCVYFLEAFSYQSMLTVTPAFFDQVISKQSMKDSESIKMLNMALDPNHIILDPLALFDWGDLGYQMFYDAGAAANTNANDLKHDTLVSIYSSRFDAAKQALAEYIAITDMGAIA